MSRHFPSFIDAYTDFARDKFCPESFHTWTGLSLIAGMLQRRVSTPKDKIHFFPNIYVMLVSYPGAGKSTAISRGVDLLEELKVELMPNLRIIPQQITEPALVDMMRTTEFVNIPGTTIQFPQSAGYFYADEASSSALQNTCGDFVATLTDMYDCKRVFRKKLKMDQYTTEILNPCMNMLCGSTFEYLRTLINDKSSMGGFASRIIYVVSHNRDVVETKWGDTLVEDTATKRKLVDDLHDMSKLVGPFRATREFTDLYDKWDYEFKQYRVGLNSPRLESMLIRKGTNLVKVAMLLSVSEAGSWKTPGQPELTGYHFDRAVTLIDDATKDNAFILSQALVADKTSQAGMTQAVMRAMKKSGGSATFQSVRSIIFSHGGNIAAYKETIDYMLAANLLALDGADRIKLLVNPDSYL